MTWLYKLALRCSLVGACLAIAFVGCALNGWADDWAKFASVSSTMGVSGSRICIGEASRGDIGCPSYAPTVSDTGAFNITGGLVTNAISLTTAGTTWGYLGSAASYLPNLSAGSISASSLTVNGVSVTGAGASKLASLTDVSASSPANNSLLRYNSSTSKWEAVGINNGVSTTTMMAGWPDALVCGTSVPTILWLGNNNYSGITYYYQTGNNTYGIKFNTSAQTYNSTMGWTDSSISDCEGKTITQLYAAGKAFNFIGNNGTSVSSTSLGYAITSGTTSLIANTSGTLDANAPLNVSGTVSATAVSFADSPALTCSAATAGTIKVVNGRPYICRHTP